jgi:hypothetical protein
MTAHPTPARVDVVDGRLSDSNAPTFRPRALRVEDAMTRNVVTVAPTAVASSSSTPTASWSASSRAATYWPASAGPTPRSAATSSRV